jgi:hypothetical protein
VPRALCRHPVPNSRKLLTLRGLAKQQWRGQRSASRVPHCPWPPDQRRSPRPPRWLRHVDGKHDLLHTNLAQMWPTTRPGSAVTRQAIRHLDLACVDLDQSSQGGHRFSADAKVVEVMWGSVSLLQKPWPNISRARDSPVRMAMLQALPARHAAVVATCTPWRSG